MYILFILYCCNALAPKNELKDGLRIFVSYPNINTIGLSINENKDEIVGVGGYGEVFKKDYLGKQVAVKRIPKIKVDLKRFNEEVKTSRLFSGSVHTVKFFGAFEDESFYYLVNEFIEGKSLLRSFQTGIGSTDIGRLNILVQFLEYLKFAYECKIVPSDIKMSNVIIDKKGVLRFIDYDLFSKMSPKGMPIETLKECFLYLMTDQYFGFFNEFKFQNLLQNDYKKFIKTHFLIKSLSESYFSQDYLSLGDLLNIEKFIQEIISKPLATVLYEENVLYFESLANERKEELIDNIARNSLKIQLLGGVGFQEQLTLLLKYINQTDYRYGLILDRITLLTKQEKESAVSYLGGFLEQSDLLSNSSNISSQTKTIILKPFPVQKNGQDILYSC